MAANTFGSPIIFHNKTYPSATVALDEYISNFDSQKQLIRSKYDREIQDLFLSTPNSSANTTLMSSSHQLKNGTLKSPQKTLAETDAVLSRLAISNTSTLPGPSPAISDPNFLKKLTSISSMSTEELLSQKPGVSHVSFSPQSTPRKLTALTTEAFIPGANHRHPIPTQPGTFGSKLSMGTDSLTNVAPAQALLDDNQSVATDYLLDVARKGAERAVSALTPSKASGKYISENSLINIKQRIEEQLQLAENLRASIRHIEDSSGSGGSAGGSSLGWRGYGTSAEAEDILQARLSEKRRQLYDTAGLLHPDALSPRGRDPRVPAGRRAGPPSWVQELDSDTSSIISGNLMKQRKPAMPSSVKMASTPNHGRASRRIKFDGTTSTILPNDSRRSRTIGSTNGASFRSKSAAGRMSRDVTRDRGRSRGTDSSGSYAANMSANSSRSNSTNPSVPSGGSTEGRASGGSGGSVGRGFQEIENEKHREFIRSLQRDIQDSKSSIAASTFTDELLVDSIPHVLKDDVIKGNGLKSDVSTGDVLKGDVSKGDVLKGDVAFTGVADPDVDAVLAGAKDYYQERVRDLLSTPPPAVTTPRGSTTTPRDSTPPRGSVTPRGTVTPRGAAPGRGGLDKTPDTDVILSGDRPWETRAPTPGAGSGQPGSMETLKHMLFSLQSFGSSGQDAVGPGEGRTAGNQSLDDSTAELLRKTSALTTEMETRLAPLMQTIGSHSS